MKQVTDDYWFGFLAGLVCKCGGRTFHVNVVSTYDSWSTYVTTDDGYEEEGHETDIEPPDIRIAIVQCEECDEDLTEVARKWRSKRK